MGYGYELYKASGTDDSYFDLFIQDNYNDNSEVILSREYDPALNMGHNVPNSIPNSEQGMSLSLIHIFFATGTASQKNITLSESNGLCGKCGSLTIHLFGDLLYSIQIQFAENYRCYSQYYRLFRSFRANTDYFGW